MSTDKKRILVVDDSTDDIHFVLENLKSEYAVQAATSGEKALGIAEKEPHPDVILMDVEMPGIDGYETCRRLKENPSTQNIDVIFLSSHDTIQEKMAGYEAGGSDYITKPFQPDELIQKVAVSIKNKQSRKELVAEKDTIMSGFMEVLTSSGEQGVVIEFLRNSFATNTLQELANLIVSAVAKYSLNSSVQIRSQIEVAHAGSNEPIAPLEQELLTRLKDQGRIMEHGMRLILNYGGVSLLIKNLPDDDTARGRFRDHLAILLEGAESKLASIELAQQEDARRLGMQKLVNESQQVFQEIQEEQKQHKTENMKIMDAMMLELENSFLAWGLNEEQEQTLMRVVENGVNKSMDHYEEGLKADERFGDVVKKFALYAE